MCCSSSAKRACSSASSLPELHAHRAQLPARPNIIAVGAIRNAQLRANHQTKDQ